jgi:hypothetical protein
MTHTFGVNRLACTSFVTRSAISICSAELVNIAERYSVIEGRWWGARKKMKIKGRNGNNTERHTRARVGSLPVERRRIVRAVEEL